VFSGDDWPFEWTQENLERIVEEMRAGAEAEEYKHILTVIVSLAI